MQGLQNNFTWPKIVQGLQYFINEVIPSAQFNKNLTKNDVTNALKWAVYCEKVANTTNISKDLENILGFIVKSNERIHLSHIKRSRLWLFESLFSNPLIDTNKIEKLDELAIKHLGVDDGEIIINKAKQKLNDYSSLMNLIKSADDSLYSVVKLRIIFEASLAQNVETLKEQIVIVVSSQTGFKAIIELLKSLHKLENNILGSLIIQNLVNILVNKQHTLNSELSTKLFDLPSNTLIFLCKTFPLLHSATLVLLKENEKCLKFIEEQNSKGSWIRIKDDGIDYRIIRKICSGFLSVPSLSPLTRKAIIHWCTSSSGHLWYFLLEDLQEKLE